VDFGLRVPHFAFRNPQWVAGEARAEKEHAMGKGSQMNGTHPARTHVFFS
jgi:hypothetical protein